MQLLIGIIAHGTRFTGNSLEKGPLGGSETAIIQMSRALAARGHSVTVFCQCLGEEGTYDGVSYVDMSRYSLASARTDFSLLIVHRAYTAAASKSHARMIWMWNHDICTDSAAYMQSTWNVDKHLVLSGYHLQQYREAGISNDLLNHFMLSRNGIDMADVEAATKWMKSNRVKRNPLDFCYTSRPERGAMGLLKYIWPRVVKEHPDAKLYMVTYHVPPEMMPRHVAQHIEDVYAVAETTPGVILSEGLNKRDLYVMMGRCNALLYPSTFPEISCISAMESMAMGCIPIAPRAYALAETIAPGCGITLEGKPTHADFQDRYVEAVLDVIRQPDAFDPMRGAGQHLVANHHRWDLIAEEWETAVLESFDKRFRARKEQVYQNAIYYSDVTAVRDYILQHGNPTEDLIDKAYLQQAQVIIDRHEEDPDEYERRAPHSSVYKENSRFAMALDAIESQKTNIRTLLDVGCGNGEFIAHCALKRPDIHYTGVDFSKACVESAKQFVTQENPKASAQFSTCTFQDLPRFIAEKDELYDAVFAGEIVEHMEDWKAALISLEECVRPGGIIAVTLPYGPWEAMTFLKEPDAIRRHVHHFSHLDLREIFEKKDNVLADLMVVSNSPRGELCGNWIISWRKKAGTKFGNVDLKRKMRTYRPYEKVSAVLIARNEEDNIGRCLKSVRPVVDEIIVVDTGSDDDTVRIAQKLGAQIFHHPWEEDFSTARNQSLSHVAKDSSWVLWIDCDEVLTNPMGLRKYLTTPSYNGYVIHQCHLTVDAAPQPDVPIRLFKTGLGIQFKGCIHEHPEMGGADEFDVPVNPALVIGDVKLAHYGYVHESIRRHKCLQRNLPLLMKDLKLHPTRKLGLVLLMRDYLNFCDWALADRSGLTNDHVKKLKEVVRLYKEHFADPTHMYFVHANPMYQKALKYLSMLGLMSPGYEYAPIETRIGMSFGVGGLMDQRDPACETVWFSSVEELRQYLTYNVDRFEKELPK